MTHWEYTAAGWQASQTATPAEQLMRLHVNGRELAMLMCSPYAQDELALGFLRAENIIQSLAEVRRVVVCPNGSCVEVWLTDPNPLPPPASRIITSGCGGGLTFDDLTTRQRPVAADLRLTPAQVFAQMHALYQSGTRYRQSQGIHNAALSNGEALLLTAEDIGRHNTLDRLWGQALKTGVTTAGRLLLTTGRISSEMLGKAASMGVPVVASRTAPTSLAVQLAAAWNITVLGYVRHNQLRAYTVPERVHFDLSTPVPRSTP